MSRYTINVAVRFKHLSGHERTVHESRITLIDGISGIAAARLMRTYAAMFAKSPDGLQRELTLEQTDTTTTGYTLEELENLA